MDKIHKSKTRAQNILEKTVIFGGLTFLGDLPWRKSDKKTGKKRDFELFFELDC